MSGNRSGLFLLFLLLLGSCSPPHRQADTADPAAGLTALQELPQPGLDLTGKELAYLYCQSCHQFPEPSLLTKEIWEEKVLPNMGLRLGVPQPRDINPLFLMPREEMIRLTQAGVFALQPLLAEEHWQKIVDYYLSEAPALPLPQDHKLAVKPKLSGFEVQAPAFHPSRPALTTMIRFDPSTSRLYMGDRRNLLYVLDSNTREVLDSLHLDSPASDIRFDGLGGFHLLTMGVMDPSEKSIGQFYYVPAPAGGQPLPPPLLQNLSRPVQFALADLNQDGREDVVVCGFGYHTGKLVWFENTGNGYREHMLNPLPGARRAIIHDLNQDGLPDVVALMTQGQEGVFAYYNEGGGRFRQEALLRFPPVYGSSDFDLVDFDGDGSLDILYTNGDNADYSYSLKKYHGVRLFLNDGQNNFTEKWFYPMHGASRAVAADLDGDGDLDVAAISFFPDFVKAPLESFVYFENLGKLSFAPYSFLSSSLGHWLTLETGDINQNGVFDLLLGSFILGPTPASKDLQEKWREEGVPFLILKNKRKNPGPL